MQPCSTGLLVYAGEFDTINGAYSQQEWLGNLDHRNSYVFKISDRQIYYMNNLEENKWEAGGYYRQVPQLTYLTVPGAGWAVDYDNWDTSYAVFMDYMAAATEPFVGLKCKRLDGEGCSVATQMCTAMNNCWGYLGNCLGNGQCLCRSAEWKGADCSQRSISLYDGMTAYLKSEGDKWYSLYYDGTSAVSSLKGSSAMPIDIYISAGAESDPTEFSYDMHIKDVYGDFEIDATDFHQYMSNTFAISIYVDGVVDLANEFAIKNTL